MVAALGDLLEVIGRLDETGSWGEATVDQGPRADGEGVMAVIRDLPSIEQQDAELCAEMLEQGAGRRPGGVPG